MQVAPVGLALNGSDVLATARPAPRPGGQLARVHSSPKRCPSGLWTDPLCTRESQRKNAPGRDRSPARPRRQQRLPMLQCPERPDSVSACLRCTLTEPPLDRRGPTSTEWPCHSRPSQRSPSWRGRRTCHYWPLRTDPSRVPPNSADVQRSQQASRRRAGLVGA